MREDLHVVVIGGGPAGISAAWRAARLGARVTLVSDGPVGGRAGWRSLLPSKVMLHAAAAGPRVDVRELGARISRVAESYNEAQQERLAEAGVQQIEGKARFLGPRQILVDAPGGEERLKLDRAVVASGSVPIFPDGMRPDGRRILAPRHIRQLREIPRSIAVIGGGLSGTELAYAFAALGARVAWVLDGYGVLPTFDSELSEAVTAAFLDRGVEIVSAACIAVAAGEQDALVSTEDGRTVSAEMAMVAVGRRPDVNDLAVEQAGLQIAVAGPARGGLEVDGSCRTRVEHLFAAGDVTGPPFVANKAMAQGHVAAAAAVAVGNATPEVRPDTWIMAVYCEPEAAQVGVTPGSAAASGRRVRVRRVEASRTLKASLGGSPAAGFLTLVTEAKTDVVIGGTAFGDEASEWLAPVALAVSARLTAQQIAAIFPGDPTMAELAFMAARE